jgi:hypothetical protein
MDHRKLRLRQAIYTLETPMPPDDLVTSYQDFLKYREILHYYQFNMKVLEHLIHITFEFWFSDKRISRLSLIQTTRRYAALEKTKKYTAEISNILFDLFKIIIVDQRIKGNKQAVVSIEFSINTLLRNVELNDEQLRCLLANIEKSPHIINRILRYPFKSSIVTKWALSNYENNSFRNRRAELISWMLDDDQFFTVKKQTIVDDFDYYNEIDYKRLQDYKDERDAEFIVVRDLGGKVDGIDSLKLNPRTMQPIVYDSESKVQEPAFVKRFYPALIPI